MFSARQLLGFVEMAWILHPAFAFQPQPSDTVKPVLFNKFQGKHVIKQQAFPNDRPLLRVCGKATTLRILAVRIGYFS